MGFSISWIAIKNKNLNQVLGELGLEETGETEDFPESDISGANLSNGWCHIQFNDFSSPFVKEAPVKLLSENTQVIYCQIEEHVMYSKACCWNNGSFSWSAEHDAQQDLRHIITDGNIPSEFIDIKQTHFEEQDQEGEEVDCIFDIPLVLASTITGIKHDEEPEEEAEYHVLKCRADSIYTKKPWWKFW